MAKQSEQLVKAEEELAQKENICRELSGYYHFYLHY